MRTLKKLILIFVAAAAVGLLAAGFINLRMILFSRKYILTPDEAAEHKTDAVLVLGASVRPDLRPSDMLADRISTGVAAYKAGASDKMIMSGDHGQQSYDEVATMKAYAVLDGVNADDVFMDHAGFSTYESMYRARDVFGAESLTISTQRYHLYRSIYVARKLGIEAWGVDAAIRPYTARTNIYNEVREALARIKAFVMCLAKPEPTYLGDRIELSSPAGVTDDDEYRRVLGILKDRP